MANRFLCERQRALEVRRHPTKGSGSFSTRILGEFIVGETGDKERRSVGLRVPCRPIASH